MQIHFISSNYVPVWAKRVLAPLSSWLNLLARKPAGQSTPILIAFFIGGCVPILQAQLISLSLLLCMLTAVSLLCFKFRIMLPLLGFLIGLSWASFCFTKQIQESYPTELERQSVRVEGQVIDLPVNRRGDYKFEFRVTQAYQLDGLPITELVDKKLLLSCYRCKLTILPSQHWQLTVRLKRPHGYASWGAFDYEQYLFQKRIVAKGYVRLKESNKLLGRDVVGVDNWRWRIGKKIQQLNKQAKSQTGEGSSGGANARSQYQYARQELSAGFAIILALAIGDKSGLSTVNRNVLQDTGVSHLIAISGLHVGLVFLGVGYVFAWMLFPFARVFEIVPRQHLVLIPALGSAILYSALAGFAISTQRALIMLSIYVICRLFVRDVSLFKVLLISACLIVSISPWSVLDVGFWLSCGAVFIIALANHRPGQEHKKPLSLIRLQPMLWLGMSPMTALFFGQVSLISPFVNLVMVPLFCMILIPATLFAVLTHHAGLGEGMLLALSDCFNWIYLALDWLSQLQYAKWYSTQRSWVNMLLGLGFLVVLGSFTSRKVKIIFGLVVTLLIACNSSNRLKHDELDLVLLDVGQGLAMVVLLPDYVLVYDTGPRYGSGFSAAEAVVLPYLRARGVSEIDTLIISHADNDHIGGYEAVVDSFAVKQVLSSRLDKLPNADACTAGQRWKVGGTRFSIISPDKQTPEGSNNRSCVLRIEHFNTRVLITGDIEKQVERYLLETQADNLNAEIMLVPHQGSKTSSTQAFIDAVQPSTALVAAGYRNHYGHPHADVVERYSDRNVDLVSSIENGSVLLKINSSGWQRHSYRDRERRFWHHQKKPNWDG